MGQRGNRSGNRGKGKPDVNQLAFRIVQQITGQIEVPVLIPKAPTGISMGQLGKLKAPQGKLLNKQRQAEIGREAALKRWAHAEQ